MDKYKDPGLVADLPAEMQEDIKARQAERDAKMVAKYMSTGKRTENEARALAGLPPIEDAPADPE